MNDFLFLFEKLGYKAYKVDLENDRVYFLNEAKENSWTAYLEENKEKFLLGENEKRFSIGALREQYRSESEGFRVELAEMNIRVWFCREEKGYAYILENRLTEGDVLKRLVNMYVFDNCDYFIFLDAKNNSYITFCKSSSGTPLPPEKCDDYEKEVLVYAEQFVVEEDRERVIREMQLDRVVEQLEKYGRHSISAGMLEPGRGYRRKRAEYRYYDREKKKILLSRIDITDMWMEEEKRKHEYMEMREKASTDSLTGILNLRAFREKVVEALEQRRGNSALMFLDLDNFKRVNDTCGHPTGDKLLKRVTHVLKEEMRKLDYVGRVGGDEFMIYIDTLRCREDAGKIAERICRRMEEIEYIDGKVVCISCSIGIAIAPDDGCDYEKLVKTADKYLYHAKESGKNRYFMV